MTRTLFLSVLVPLALAASAQPDTLFVPSGDTLYSYAVVYEPVQDVEQYTRTGTYAHAPGSVAVKLMYKRGKPSGTYRAFFPDGRPLIFAVYGWGTLHGDWTEYDEFGRITIKGQYRDGKREGTWAFRKDGIIGKYHNGLRHGKWKYYANGKLVRIEKFHKDEPVKGGTFRVR